MLNTTASYRYFCRSQFNNTHQTRSRCKAADCDSKDGADPAMTILTNSRSAGKWPTRNCASFGVLSQPLKHLLLSLNGYDEYFVGIC